MSDSQIRTGQQVRQDFLDFFQSKRHSIVPSDNLGYQSRDGAKIFTNAGMNQFVPIFLGERKADVDKWPGAVTDGNTLPTRAADTQKCIRAGGKHNDLDDVGLDTYHHTFFEMLGNWSFGDYFKAEAIEWAWELLTGVWKFPKERLYATVYKPGEGDPADFDQEAYDLWKAIFEKEGLDPEIHIVYGNKKDNFWMMGDTGPCGPCSEVHIDLTQQGDTKGALVNKDSSECIEIWNLVFIQFNANADGSFSPLPAQHVDTGMGFERVCAVMQNTNGFTNFKCGTSNYETDVFRPIFNQLEELSGKKYGSTLPREGTTGATDQEKVDVAFRVIADHIRTLSFSIADGLIPGNTDRNYTLRRILRRAVRYGRTLGFHEPFFFKLVDVVVAEFGGFFPELQAKQELIVTTLKTEEVAFNKTLDTGLKLLDSIIQLQKGTTDSFQSLWPKLKSFIEDLCAIPDDTTGWDHLKGKSRLREVFDLKLANEAPDANEVFLAHLQSDAPLFPPDEFWQALDDRNRWAVPHLYDVFKLIKKLKPGVERDESYFTTIERLKTRLKKLKKEFESRSAVAGIISGKDAFTLYDTYGFPVDLTDLIAREHNLVVDVYEFEREMNVQRDRARLAQKKTVIEIADIGDLTPTDFTGFDTLGRTSTILQTVQLKEEFGVILDKSPFYAEMGGQVGDTGRIFCQGNEWEVSDTRKIGETWVHTLQGATAENLPNEGSEARVSVDAERRAAIQRHHSVTHVFHWALHEIASKDATQKGSYVGPDKLTFDFNSQPLTPQQIADIEKLVNERIVENAGISWSEVPYTEVQDNAGIMQLFGEKYGEKVRVVQIGGAAGSLDGWSMELCGGTHTRATGEIGLFRIVGESAISAGVRRIEAIAGLEAYGKARSEAELIATLAGKINSPIGELERKVENLLAQQKQLDKQLKAMKQKQAGATAKELLAKAVEIGGKPAIVENLGDEDGNYCQAIADALRGEFNGVVVLAGAAGGSVALVATVDKSLTGSIRAGDIIKTIAPVVGGKGGGKPEQARGGGKDAAKVGEALEAARQLLAG